MSKTECKRCGGEGMGQHSRAQGMCYLCGRMPGEGHAAPVVSAGDARAKSIATLRVMIVNATREQEAGELAAWLDWTDADCNPTVIQAIRAEIKFAPSDVAARARAAFARLGVAA